MWVLPGPMTRNKMVNGTTMANISIRNRFRRRNDAALRPIFSVIVRALLQKSSLLAIQSNSLRRRRLIALIRLREETIPLWLVAYSNFVDFYAIRHLRWEMDKKNTMEYFIIFYQFNAIVFDYQLCKYWQYSICCSFVSTTETNDDDESYWPNGQCRVNRWNCEWRRTAAASG